ncbi:MAG TPA: chemotaxis-specific protein-glutamate methyltransferase CheB [Thermoanaerobaculia bacterium]|nr:chemotaxis-specific protein-glutamate methyltransferase CheB [Thermoanaerobaculia bacterium]
MINVLIVEDSAVVRELLIHILGSDREIRIAGAVHNGEEALEAVARERPDVITMDIHMPRMDGLEATRRIMETWPTPIVIVSGTEDPREATVTFRAIEAGALTLLPRPLGIAHPDHDATARELVQTVKLMSEVRVVRRWPRTRGDSAPPVLPGPVLDPAPAGMQVVALGASTGGPPVLQAMLARLPKDFPAPVLIVQHMAAGFIEGFVHWLAQSCAMPVHVASHGETIRAGHVYVARDGFQMTVERGGRIVLSTDGGEGAHRPSVSCLFRSVAELYGQHAVAALLTGMGRDGAAELRVLREKGAITFAQDQASCAVFGMSAEAIRLDAAMYVLRPERIADALVSIANDRKGRRTDGIGPAYE